MVVAREMAVGNTFGATALSSYGGFWISYAIIYTPGGFNIINEMVEGEAKVGLNAAVGFWLIVSTLSYFVLVERERLTL